MTGTRTARPWSRCGGRGSREPHQQGGKDHPGTVAGRQLVVSGRHRTKVLEAVHAPFYDVALPVADQVNRWRTPATTGDLIAALWDGVPDPAPAQQRTAGGVAVALVSDHVVGALAGPPTAAGPWHTDAVQNRLQLGGLMALARVTTMLNTRPRPSAARWTLVVSPPRERPSAWSGSAAAPLCAAWRRPRAGGPAR